MDFYREKKWCAGCRDYVQYLMSVNHSFCITCGTQVRLFSKPDSERFTDEVKRHKWQAS
jgi:rRNA maturation endonuclease Nob1